MRERKMTRQGGRSSRPKGENAPSPIERKDVETLLPVIEEEAVVLKERYQSGVVRVETRVDTEEKLLDVPLMKEEFQIDREARNEIIDAPLEPWHEGDTLILPVMEEIVVVEKKVVLKELVRITRVRREEQTQKRVLLRKQRVDVERMEDSETDR